MMIEREGAGRGRGGGRKGIIVKGSASLKSPKQVPSPSTLREKCVVWNKNTTYNVYHKGCITFF
jgi:hypothetical protein